jgi:hypothetical protein
LRLLAAEKRIDNGTRQEIAESKIMGGSPYAEEQDAPVHFFDLDLHIAPICDGREPGPCRWGILNPDL